MSARDSILKKIGSLDSVKEEIPEWGITVTIKPLTVGEMMDVAVKSNGNEETAIGMLSAALLDNEGNQIFTTSEMAELPQSQMAVITRLINLMTAMNGTVEEAEKN